MQCVAFDFVLCVRLLSLLVVLSDIICIVYYY